jgi:putative oxidoreductase
MRRLYSTFATGLPGIGVLIMRLVAGAVSVGCGLEALLGDLAMGPPALLIARVTLGVLLIAGLWTPVAGALVVVLETSFLSMRAGDPWLHVLLMTLGLCLALLGPGAWSLDARLFGWRRIYIRNREGRR